MPHFRLRTPYAILLALAGTAAFFWNMATRTDEPDLRAELFVVTGTADSFRTANGGPGTSKRNTPRHFLVKLREHPRVEFQVQRPPGRELVPGTPVRFEMRTDPEPMLRAARSHGNPVYWIAADSFVADGTAVYTVAEARARNDAAVKRFRGISLLLWAVVVIWIALLAWRHRVLLRSLRHSDGASAAVDRLRRWVYRE